MKILSHPDLVSQVKRRKKAIPIKTLLIIGFLVSGLIPTLVVSLVSCRTTLEEMKEQVFRQLESVRNIKKEQIHNFFNERIADISTFSENPICIEAYKELASAFKQAGGEFKGFSREKFTAPGSYLVIHRKYFSFFKNLVSHYGYYDLFLLDPIYGYNIFTVQKEADFGIRISEVSSSLRDVWIKTVSEKKISLSDTKAYSPSNNIPAQFLAAPILENDRLRGVIAVQISIDSIDNIMKERSGMWKTGETYLVGQDKKMRSDSFLDNLNHSVKASFRGTVEKNGVDTEASRQALSGIEDKKILVDYRGKSALTAYSPIDIKDVRWALIAEVDEDEIDEQIARALNPRIIILTALTVLLLLFLILIISTFIHKGIRDMISRLENMIGDILLGKFRARIDPASVGVDFQGVMARTNELLDAFVEQMEEKRKLENQVQSNQRLEALGTLAGGIAHDFNNILTSMHAHATIIKKSIPRNQAANENMKELITAIRRASELVEQILTFSGDVKTKEKFVNISRVIQESIKLFKAALPRNIRVETHLSPGPLQVIANPTQIRQVIMNLYSNACRAMQQEGGTLTISTGRVKRTGDAVLNLKSGCYCKISVEDTGHGMNRETQKRIFEPFFSTRPKGEGTGLGLSVVHGIVKTYGGVIEVESEPGKGSRFDVYLPLAREAGANIKKDRESQ